MRTLIRGLGGILTGDLTSPHHAGSVVVVEDGRIAEISDRHDAPADEVIDAGGAWAAPGLWDGAASLYFGDHEPQFSARGAIAASVEYGTTTLVINGRAPVPGWVGTPRSNRELAVLTMKSWRFDRPRGINVVSGAICGDPAWTSEDLEDLVRNGASTVMLPAGSAPQALAAAVRAAGLRLGIALERKGQGPAVEAVAALEPDVVMVNDASGSVARDLLGATSAILGVTLAGGVAAATDLVCAAADRRQLGRLFLGSGLPGRSGVLPGAIALFLETLASTTGLGRDQLWSLCSGNTARAYAVQGGTIAIGERADVVLIDAESEARSTWSRPVRLTLINGAIAWGSETER